MPFFTRKKLLAEIKTVRRKVDKKLDKLSADDVAMERAQKRADYMKDKSEGKDSSLSVDKITEIVNL